MLKQHGHCKVEGIQTAVATAIRGIGTCFFQENTHPEHTFGSSDSGSGSGSARCCGGASVYNMDSGVTPSTNILLRSMYHTFCVRC